MFVKQTGLMISNLSKELQQSDSLTVGGEQLAKEIPPFNIKREEIAQSTACD